MREFLERFGTIGELAYIAILIIAMESAWQVMCIWELPFSWLWA
jgi:hypothetical protein